MSSSDKKDHHHHHHDDVLIVDIGSSSVKAGFSGEDSPSSVFPSCLATNGKHPRTLESIDAYTPIEKDKNSNDYGEYGAKSLHPVIRGSVKDWEGLEKLWDATLDHVGVLLPEAFPVMIIESPTTTTQDRRNWAELLFEKYKIPSLCFGNSAACTVFAAGRTSGLVVDCGAGLTTTVPVFEGLALKHAEICIQYGGQDTSALLKKILIDMNITVELSDAQLLKERFASVSSSSSSSSSGDESFYLPDGRHVTVPSRIFTECTAPIFKGSYVPPTGENVHPAAVPAAGVTNQIFESWYLSDDGIRKELAQNIILSGGSSFIPGLGDRIESELTEKINSTLDQRGLPLYSTRVLPSSSFKEAGYSYQRKFASFIGGSLVASLDNFKNIRITRQEYEEDADAAIKTKIF